MAILAKNSLLLVFGMKKLLVFAALLALISGCKKSDAAKPVDTSGISYSFNGTSKNATTFAAVYSKTQQTLLITGTSLSGTDGITLSIPNIQPGTFDVVKNSLLLSYSSAPDAADTYTATAGTVTVTTFNGSQVIGTFQFSGSTPGGAAGAISGGKFQLQVTTAQ